MITYGKEERRRRRRKKGRRIKVDEEGQGVVERLSVRGKDEDGWGRRLKIAPAKQNPVGLVRFG